MSNDFKIWWHNEGSGMPPFKDEETCDHVERVSAIAWSNGAFKATLSLEAENARLKAEVERWKGNHAVVIEDRNTVLSSLVNMKAEVERLRAASFVTSVPVEQYERVIKAGQAMADVCGWHGTYEAAEELVKAWEAAKEGKPNL